MLQRSPRRKLLNDYAKQLLRRYPSMKEDIKSRLQHLNQHWAEIESRITAQYAPVQHGSMIRGGYQQSLLIFRGLLKYCCFFSLEPSTAHIKYSSVMLALYIYIVLDRNKKQNFVNFFVSDYQIIPYGLMALSLCCEGLG